MLSIINHIPQIFQNSFLFGGLAVILAGDPRQIVPVAGRALFFINKYFHFTCDSAALRNRKQKAVQQDILNDCEMQGYEMYSHFIFHAPLSQSIRLRHSGYAKLNLEASQYKVTSQHLTQYNKFYKTYSELHKNWLDAIWMFPS